MHARPHPTVVRPLLFAALLGALMLPSGCSGGKTHTIVPPPEPKCGDGNIDVDKGEQCEGSNLAGKTCQTQGFDEGQLNCSATCQFDTTLCTKHCGNGVIDQGEQCDGDAGVSACTDYGFNACNGSCALVVNHCVATLFQAGNSLVQPMGGPATLGDLEPKGLGDLIQVVPSFQRVEVFAYLMGQGFPASRKLSFLRSPAQAFAVDVDGDGKQDVVARNDDGSLDAYLAQATAFNQVTYPDAGCPLGRLVGVDRPKDGGSGTVLGLGCPVGAGFQAAVFARNPADLPVQVAIDAVVATPADVDHDGVADLLAVGSDGGLTVVNGAGGALSSLSLPSGPVTALVAGDLDGDGDLDLLVVVGGTVRLWENTGSGYAERTNFGGTQAALPVVADLDADGRLDLLWVDQGQAKLRHNQGGFVFTSDSVTLGPGTGTPLSIDLGDVDDDGDLDVVVTFSTGGDSTRTDLLLNQVQ